MRPNGTRKRPASAISTSGLEHFQDFANHNRNSSPPRMMESPSQMRMQPPQMPTGLPEYTDSSNNYTGGLYGSPYYNPSQPQPPSGNLGTELVRTQQSNQIVPMPNYNDGYNIVRPDLSGPQPHVENGFQGQGQYDDLDQRASLAQSDAQSKRKQIPPFVQKLSSFLDENTRNTDLIRWSDSGDSFIVVDEDEFAKTLIPELFKHNNYASFVRQLNMYGFHKKVGLSDNSMRASERKNKNPSEYSNPYFKRGKPNLLWLIHKPKNAPTKGAAKNSAKAKQEDVEEEAEDFFPHDTPVTPAHERVEDAPNSWNTPRLALPPTTDGHLPPEQFRNLQQEMADIRRQQNRITEMLSVTRRDHVQLYSQAKVFHELHEKHDNSINAILTFLATVYNKNMNDKGLDFRNMFGPNTLSGKSDGHDIIDVEEEKQSSVTTPTQHTYRKKRPLLLKDKASPIPSVDSPGLLNPWPADPLYSASKPEDSPFHSPAIQEIHELSPSNRDSQSPQNSNGKADLDQTDPDSGETMIPHRDILSVIRNQNARDHRLNGTQMEFPEALSRLQNTDGQSPLTPSQRQNMLRLMSDEQASSLPTGNANNALTSYSPPIPAANLNMSSERLSQIEHSLREQENHLANLQATIAPLSPSGSIPGVNDHTYNSNPELDLDSIFNSGDYFNDGTDPASFDFTNGADLPDFDFSTAMDPVGDQGQEMPQLDGIDEGRVKEMDSSEATSPANTVNTIDDEGQVEQSPRKLRRKN